MSSIQIKHLSYSYAASKRSTSPRKALQDVSFTVESGEIFGLLGPNGGGKTTLFKILSTLLAPTEGRAFIGGHDLSLDGNEARKMLGVVFQNPSLDKKLTLHENLIHHGHLYGIRGDELKKRIEETSGQMGVADRLDDRVQSLSGGLQRRGEIAKALLSHPSVLLMDEPSTGLDPGARRALRDTLLTLKKKGVTIFLTTHLMEEGDVCDRLAILHLGKIVAMGAPTELKGRIGGDVITIETDSPESAAVLIRQKFQIDPRIVEGSIRLEKKDGHAFIPALVEALPGLVKTIRLGKPTLEDVFAKETGQTFWSLL